MNIDILIVDDDAADRDSLKFLLSSYFEAEIHVATTCAEALQRFRTHPYKLITIDGRLPDGTGAELVRKIRLLKKAVTIIMITGDLSMTIAGVAAGADHGFTKPVDVTKLIEFLRQRGFPC